MILISKTRKI